CSLLAPSDAILFQEGVSVKLRLPHGYIATLLNPPMRGFFCTQNPVSYTESTQKGRCDHN
ncbi:hypothetical protein, partial [Escherichia coli]|uniref:hypothetical protein n=1 Tax=Escherichia coli TaxID=562 RepID=UPI001BC8C820